MNEWYVLPKHSKSYDEPNDGLTQKECKRIRIVKEVLGQHAPFEESDVVLKAHKYEVQREKGIGCLENEQGKCDQNLVWISLAYCSVEMKKKMDVKILDL